MTSREGAGNLPGNKQEPRTGTQARQIPDAKNKRHRYATARDPAAALAALTRNCATFTERDVQRVAAPAIVETVLRHPDIIRLPHDGSNQPRYTTRQILEAEQEVLRAAEALADDAGHEVSPRVVKAILARPLYRTITQEQRRAFRHATAASGLAVIDGQAGTGKSFVLGAIREAYEAEGYNVIGLAPTNAVVQQLREDGFAQARTIHSALHASTRAISAGPRAPPSWPMKPP